MKSLVVVVLGLASGLWLSAAVGGCASDRCPNLDPVAPGAFVPDSASGAENDYILVLDGTTRTAIETFTRDGQSYRLEYAVTGDLATANAVRALAEETGPEPSPARP
jgi:hypothetical protein